MKVIGLGKVRKQKVGMRGAAGAWRQKAVGSLDGSPTCAFRVFTLEPGGHTPFHAHPFEHVNYFISGIGSLVRHDGKKLKVAQGDFALVPPGERHQYRNESKEEALVFICAVPLEYEG